MINPFPISYNVIISHDVFDVGLPDGLSFILATFVPIPFGMTEVTVADC